MLPAVIDVGTKEKPQRDSISVHRWWHSLIANEIFSIRALNYFLRDSVYFQTLLKVRLLFTSSTTTSLTSATTHDKPLQIHNYEQSHLFHNLLGNLLQRKNPWIDMVCPRWGTRSEFNRWNKAWLLFAKFINMFNSFPHFSNTLHPLLSNITHF